MGILSLPHPYPDELILSVLSRALIHNGLAPKRLLMRLVGVSGRSSYSYFLPTNLSDLASQTRMDAKALLWEHTVFPYSVAFMPPGEVLRLEEKLLARENAEKGWTGALVKSATRAVPELRFCFQCAQEELHNTGESYWHRSHCLPGIEFCLKHGVALKPSSSQPRTFSQQLQVPLPHREEIQVHRNRNPTPLQISIARTTAAICSRAWAHRENWLEGYRSRALAQQFALSPKLVAGARMAYELQKTFGDDFLNSLTCGYSSFEGAWPSLMVRPQIQIPFAPIKHVLLDVFLNHNVPTQSAFSYKKPGKLARSSIDLDQLLAAEVQRRSQIAMERKELLSLRDLLQDIGKWQIFRHNRRSLPLTVAEVKIFKSSESSQRKIGGRDAHAKKLTAIAEGRQKPFVYKPRTRKQLEPKT